MPMGSIILSLTMGERKTYLLLARADGMGRDRIHIGFSVYSMY